MSRSLLALRPLHNWLNKLIHNGRGEFIYDTFELGRYEFGPREGQFFHPLSGNETSTSVALYDSELPYPASFYYTDDSGEIFINPAVEVILDWDDLGYVAPGLPTPLRAANTEEDLHYPWNEAKSDYQTIPDEPVEEVPSLAERLGMGKASSSELRAGPSKKDKGKKVDPAKKPGHTTKTLSRTETKAVFSAQPF
ncbi:hypothetical protein BDZ89DRAFT_1149368 [Hymenopellis radicata]|nr:hypothetical protein BDZ89DRAFT_1149368 [Hymenopellis radicata]